MTSIKTWLGICLSVLLLIGCGGGGDAGGPDANYAGVGSGGTGGGGNTGRSYAAGVITAVNDGVVVNGIHFDASGADVRHLNNPDERLLPGVLQPGMMVEIDGTGIEEQGGKRVAKAVSVRIASQVLGRVLEIREGVPYVLGMRVLLTENTLYDEATLPGGKADIAVNDVIEVHGFLDSTQVATLPAVVATRVIRRNEVDQLLFFVQGLIEAKGSLTPDGRQPYKLVGLPFTWLYTPSDFVSGRSAVRLTFPAALLNNAPLLDKETLTNSLEQLIATVKITMPAPEDEKGLQIDAYLDGVVTALDPVNDQHFWINNLEINARRVPHLACIGLKKGERVRVHGWVVRGQVQATRVVRLDKVTVGEAGDPSSNPPVGCSAPAAASASASMPTTSE